MEVYLVILVLFGIISMMAFLTIVHGQRKKDLQNLRTLDLRIIALENGGGFRTEGRDIHAILETKNVAYTPKGRIYNVIQQQYVGFKTTIFDGLFAMDIESRQFADLTGVALHFDQAKLPEFKITQNVYSNMISLSRYSQVQSNTLPSSIRQATAIFAFPEAHTQICDLIREHSELQEIVTDWDFRGLFCNDKRVVLYLRGSYESTEVGFAEMKGYVNKLISIFGENNTDVQIELLKQAEQNN